MSSTVLIKTKTKTTNNKKNLLNDALSSTLSNMPIRKEANINKSQWNQKKTTDNDEHSYKGFK